MCVHIRPASIPKACWAGRFYFSCDLEERKGSRMIFFSASLPWAKKAASQSQRCVALPFPGIVADVSACVSPPLPPTPILPLTRRLARLSSDRKGEGRSGALACCQGPGGAPSLSISRAPGAASDSSSSPPWAPPLLPPSLPPPFGEARHINPSGERRERTRELT